VRSPSDDDGYKIMGGVMIDANRMESYVDYLSLRGGFAAFHQHTTDDGIAIELHDISMINL
jgi:hypothetical protein